MPQICGQYGDIGTATQKVGVETSGRTSTWKTEKEIRKQH
jgi:hypothetical protein